MKRARILSIFAAGFRRRDRSGATLFPATSSFSGDDGLTGKAADTIGDLLPPEPPPALTDLIPRLTRFVEESEADFMLLGIGLRSVYSNVTELTDLMLGTVKQIDAEEDGGFLAQGRQILKDSLAEIRAYHDGVRDDLGRINVVMTELESLCNTSRQIKNFAKSLKIVAMIMLVENGRTMDDSVNIFADVAREIKELSVSISAIANDVHSHVEKARQMHRLSREEISSRIKRLERLTTEIEATVQTSTHDTEMLMQLSVDTVEQAGQRSRNISRQVAEIVVGVQFHDNMKQRITHIMNVLNAVLASFGTADAVSSASAGGETKPADQLIREQVDRLREINADVSGVFQKNRSALREIEKAVVTLLLGLESMSPGSREEGTIALMQDPFSHLQDTLTQLHGLLDRGKVLYEQIQKTAEHVSGITAEMSQLLTVVRGISSHTHNKAINSIIVADRRGGQAGAMKLLAQEMNSLASQSDVFTREVEGIINAIIGEAGDIGRREHRRSSDGGIAGGAIIRLNEVLNDISLGYDSFRKDSLAALERAGDLKKAVDATFAGLDFFGGLSGRIDDFCRQLAAIAGHPGLDRIRVGVKNEAGHMPARHTDDSFDNVILFERSRKTQTETGHEPFDHALGDNVDLF